MNKSYRLLFFIRVPDVLNLTTPVTELHWKLETKLRKNAILLMTVAENLIPLGYILSSES